MGYGAFRFSLKIFKNNPLVNFLNVPCGPTAPLREGLGDCSLHGAMCCFLIGVKLGAVNRGGMEQSMRRRDAAHSSRIPGPGTCIVQSVWGLCYDRAYDL